MNRLVRFVKTGQGPFIINPKIMFSARQYGFYDPMVLSAKRPLSPRLSRLLISGLICLAAAILPGRAIAGPAEDLDLARMVAERLAVTDGIDPTNIVITSHNGVVVLSGGIASEAERAAVLEAVRAVDGVKGIASHLVHRRRLNMVNTDAI